MVITKKSTSKERTQNTKNDRARHRGGRKVSEEYGSEFYREIGRRGGKATAATHDKDFYRDIGHRGGQKVSEEYGPEFYREIGRRGGSHRSSKGKQEEDDL